MAVWASLGHKWPTCWLLIGLLVVLFRPSSCQNGTVVQCEKTQVSLACDTHINVLSALYGRIGMGVDDDICPAGTLTPCGDADVSLSSVQSLCQGMSTCTFTASNANFGGDPCSGTGKYLRVNYTCEFTGITEQCENSQVSLGCDEVNTIDVLSALYGRIGMGVDDDICPAGSLIPCGDADVSLSSVQSLCQGMSNCTFTASNANFGGDPCGGTGKYLRVNYTCTDQDPPSIVCPSNATVYVERDELFAYRPFPTNYNASDNSGSYDVMIYDTGAIQGPYTPGSLYNFSLSASPYTWFYVASDAAGNEDNCTVQIYVVPAPTVTIWCPQPATGNTDNGQSFSSTIVLEPSEPVATHDLEDGSSVVTVVTNISCTINDGSNITLSGSPQYEYGVNNITCTAYENSTQTQDSCTFQVTVTDPEPPSLQNCPANLQFDTDLGNNTATVNWTLPTITDNVDYGTSLSASHQSPAAFGVGVTTVNIRGFDAAGNEAATECEFNVTVTDNEDPILMCPSDQVVNATRAAELFLNVSAFDFVDGNITPVCIDVLTGMTIAIPISQEFPPGTNPVNCTAIDAQGNMDECAFNVTVIDDAPPNITCQDVSVDAMPGMKNATVNYVITVEDEDDVTVVCDTMNGTVFDFGEAIVSCNATDATGNTAMCSFTVSVNDVEPPVIANCPMNIMDATAEMYYNVSWAPPNATDNCDSPSEINVTSTHYPGDSFLAGSDTEVTYTFTDTSNNSAVCNFTVSVTDVGIPEFITCPETVEFVLDPGRDMALVNYATPIVQDNSLEMIVPQANPNLMLPVLLPYGQMSVKYTAVDAAGGNADPCVILIIVKDEEDPVITDCPESVYNLTTEPGLNTAAYNWTEPMATDNVELVSFNSTRENNGSLPIGNITIRYTAIDPAGNMAICEFELRVLDLEPPEVLSCPNDTAVSTNPGSNMSYVKFVTAIDFDDNDRIESVVMSHRSGSLFIVGNTTVLNTATDASGNEAVCTFLVTVTDEESPVFSGCENITIATNPGMPGDNYTTVNWPGINVTDNVGVVNMTSSHMEGSVFPVGETGVDLTAEDAAGNVGRCSFLVTVVDLEAPTVMGCPMEVVNTTDFRVSSSVVYWQEPVITDNVGVTNSSSSHVPGDVFPVGNTTVTYTAIDDAGNVNMNCSFVVTVEDDEPPQLMCLSLIVANTTDNQNSSLVFWPEPMVSDNVGVIGNESSHSSGDVFPLGNTSVTYNFTDEAGNEASCTFVVQVVDNEAPVIMNCPADAVNTTAPGQNSSAVHWSEPLLDDNVGIVVSNQSHSPGDVFLFGNTTVTYTVADEAGNTNECVFIVEVIDDEDPTVTTCPGHVVNGTDPAISTSVVYWQEPTFADNVGIDDVISTHNPGDVFDLGNSTVTYTATDTSGNTAICSFVVTVEDVEAPVIASCMDVTIETDTGLATSTQSWMFPEATDNVNVTMNSSSHQPGDTLPLGPTGVTYIVYDAAGLNATCDFDVIVEDNEMPNITNCPVDVTINATDSAALAVYMFSTPTCTDNTGAVTVTNSKFNNDMYPIGDTSVTIACFDEAGNNDRCLFTITVQDVTPPQLGRCPDNQEAFADPGMNVTVNWTHPLAMDNSGSVNLTSDYSPGDAFMNGTYVVTYTAEDADGNSVSCNFTVTVYSSDYESPMVVTCPNDTVLPAEVDSNSTVVTWPAPVITDNVGVTRLDLSHPNGSLFYIGPMKVRYTAYDLAGNRASCNFTVTVEDTQAPVLVNCSEDITAFTGAMSTQNGINLTLDTPVVIENDMYTLDQQPNPGHLYTVGNTTVRFTVRDPSRLNDSCEFVVTVVDNTPPNFPSCPSSADVPTDPGVAFANVTWMEPVAMDNVGVVYYTNTSLPGTIVNLGEMLEVVYVAHDAAGLNATCRFNFTVIDEEDPVIMNCSGVVVANATVNESDAQVFWTPPTAVDNSGVVTLTVTKSPGTMFDIGTTGVTYVAIDDAGLTDVCMFDVIVQDVQDPVITMCPSDIYRFTYPGTNISVVWAPPMAQDNSGSVTLTSNYNSGDEFYNGTYTVIYTAMDESGNMAECTFVVQINSTDTQPPMIYCPADISLPADNGSDSTAVTWLPPPYMDNNRVVSVNVTRQNGSLFYIGSEIVVYTAYDVLSNSDSCNFTVTVLDDQDPVIANCPSDVSSMTDPGQPDATISWIAPMISDNSRSFNVDLSHPNGSAFPVAVTEVTYRVTDNSSNSAMCSFNVTITDDEDPMFDCPSDFTNETLPGQSTGTFSVPFVVMDNVNVTFQNFTHQPGDALGLGMTNVVYYARDAAGNEAFCRFTVTIEDNEKPQILNCTSDVYANASRGSNMASVMWPQPTATDNSGFVTLTDDIPRNNMFPIADVVVTYGAIDSAGNVETCKTTVHVSDVEDPMVVCPENVEAFADNGTTIRLNWTMPTASDNSGIFTVTSSHPQNSEFPLGPTDITITVIDSFGNGVNCTFSVIVYPTDPERPIIICPAHVTGIADLGTNSTNVTWDLPEYRDNEEVIVVEVDYLNGSLFSVGNTPVTYFIADRVGNNASCSFNVTVFDNQCSSEPCWNGGSCVASSTGFTCICAAPFIGLYCESQSHPHDLVFVASASPAGIYVAPTDTFNFTLIPGLDASHVNISQPIAIDYDPVERMVYWTDVTLDVIARAFLDGSGVEVVVRDLRSPGGLALDIENHVMYWTDEDSDLIERATLDGRERSVVFNLTNSSLADVEPRAIVVDPTNSHLYWTDWGTIPKIERAGTDGSGSRVLIDTDIKRPNGVALDLEGGRLYWCDSYFNVIESSDLLGQDRTILVQSTTSLQKFDLFVYYNFIYWTERRRSSIQRVEASGRLLGGHGSDSFGTPYGIHIFKAEDVPLLVNCPSNIELYLYNGSSNATAYWTAPTVTEYSGNVTLDQQYVSGDQFPFGVTEVVLNASTEAGNTASCLFNITVIDESPPIILNCPGGQMAVSDDVASLPNVSWPPVNATDNIEVASVIPSQAPGTSFPVGTTHVSYTATDTSGNTNVDTCEFYVVVTDSAAPEFVNCPTDITVPNDPGMGGASVNWTEPTAIDNDNVTVFESTHKPNDNFTLAMTEVTYTIFDTAGNNNTCSFIVTVNDMEAPVFVNCPINVTTETPPGSNMAAVTWEPLVAIDNSGAAISPSSASRPGDSFAIGTHPVMFVAVDPDNNIGRCNFDIIVVEGDALMIACPADVSQPTDQGANSTIVTWPAPMYNSSMMASLTSTHPVNSSFEVGRTVVVYTITGRGGKNASCDFSVTVTDDQSPVLTGCSPPVSGNTSPSLSTGTTFWSSPTANDNVGVTNLTSNYAPNEPLPIGPTNVIYTAVDAAGNSVNCSFVVTIQDNEDPMFTFCPMSMEFNTDGNGAIVVPAIGMPNVTDNAGPPMMTSDYNVTTLAVGSSTLVTFSAIDDSGNVATCAFNITIVDATPPVIPDCPGDMVIPTDVGLPTALANWTQPTATDNDVIVSFEPDIDLQTPLMLGTTEVTYVATDAEGLTAECKFNVTVEDQEKPVISSCPINSLGTNTPGASNGSVFWIEPTAEDNVGVINLTSNYKPYDVLPVGTTEIVYEAVDAAGNVEMCRFNAIISDIEAPVFTFCPANFEIPTGANGSHVIPTWPMPVATDNAGPLNVTNDYSGLPLMVGTVTTITYTAVDDFSLMDTCSFNITVVDGTQPEITGCPDDVTVPNARGLATGQANWTAPTADDNVGVVNFTTNYNSGEMFDIGTTEVTYIATDERGLVAVCQFNVTVEDTEAPVLMNCPSSLAGSTSPGKPNATVSWPNPTASDNSGSGMILDSTYSPGDTFPIGQTIVVYTATDPSGNSVNCSYRVIVMDYEVPVFTFCPEDLTLNLENVGDLSIVPSWDTPVATDNAGPPNVTTDYMGEAFAVNTTTTVTYTAVDSSGNPNTCSFTVTIADAVAPKIVNCPASFVVNTTEGMDNGVASWTAPTATDDQELVSFVASHTSPLTLQVGELVVNYTATDNQGLVTVCEFTITVQDAEDPVITGCPLTTIATLAPGAATANPFWIPPMATDNVGVESFDSNANPNDPMPAGTNPVTYTATDAAGNIAICSFNVVVSDNEVPVFTFCPESLDFPTSTNGSYAVPSWPAPNATDNTGVTTITSDYDGQLLALGSTTLIVYTVEDGSANTDTCSFNVTIIDGTPPTILNCPASFTVSSDVSQSSGQANWTEPLAEDNVEVVSFTSDRNSGDFFLLGTTLVTYVATDPSGYASECSFNVTVGDTIKPVITGCPGDIAVNATQARVVDWTPPTAMDNVAVVNESATHQPNETFALGSQTTVTYRFEDEAGNFEECSFIVTIYNATLDEDLLPMFVSCPSDQVVPTEPGRYNASVTWSVPTATDRESNPTVVGSLNPGDVFSVSNTSVTYTATDSKGQTDTCVFFVTVQDEESPVLSNCPSRMDVVKPPSDAMIVVDWTPPTVTDNSGVVTLTPNKEPGSMFGAGESVIIYTGIDEAGNMESCNFTVNVTGDVAPVFVTCPSNIVTNTTFNEAFATVVWAVPVAEDDVSTPIIVEVNGYNPGRQFSMGTWTVEYVATDSAQQTATCQFNITVIDREDPVIEGCPADINRVTLNNAPLTITWTPPVATDNSGEYTLMANDNHKPGETLMVGSYDVIYTVRDPSSNTDTCEFTIVIENDAPPEFVSCPPSSTVPTDPGQNYATVSFSFPTPSDDRSNPQLVGSHAPGHQFPIGDTTVTYTAYDSQGQSAECVFVITVEDRGDPVIMNCPAGQTIHILSTTDVAAVYWTPPMANDTSALTLSSNKNSGDTFESGSTQVRYTAIDSAGNADTCTFSVLVLETIPSYETDGSVELVSIASTAKPFNAGFIQSSQDVLRDDLDRLFRRSSVSSDFVGISLTSTSVGGDDQAIIEFLISFTGTPAPNDTEISAAFYAALVPTSNEFDDGNEVSPNTFMLSLTSCPAIPCDNGGSCVPDGNSFVCMCTAFWTGDYCAEDVNECVVNNPCAMDRVCINIEGSYLCGCAAGFFLVGDTCVPTSQFSGSFAITRIGSSEATFTSDLQDPTSEQYQRIAGDVTTVLDDIFSDESTYISSSIVGMSSGSIMIRYVLTFSEDTSMNEDMVTRQMSNSVSADGEIAGSALYIRPSSLTYANHICPDGFCKNGGRCSPDPVTYDSTCSCESPYSGDRCEITDVWSPLVIAMVAVAAVLLVVLAGLFIACCCFLSKRLDEEPKYPGSRDVEQRKTFVQMSRLAPQHQGSAVDPPRNPRGRSISTSFASHTSQIDAGSGVYRRNDDDSSDMGTTSYQNQAFDIPYLEDEEQLTNHQDLASRLQQEQLQVQRVGYANDMVPDYPQSSTFMRPYMATGQEAMEHYYNDPSEQRRLGDNYF
ncbi:uncharacterized protein LOC119724809 isoform X2 [Patiria miniata]|uniref:Hyalin n=1 Tax=Patiria miniata TaxID=46514 RepID=A0A913ZLI5_PATMI|nr:uncharacterized protein LOC119724809 isoform X2 [Patiria miniata]